MEKPHQVAAVAAIRVATLGDSHALTALWRACGLVVPTNDPVADLRFALAGACSTVLVGQAVCGRVIGSAMVGHDGHRGWLYYVAADPALRGQGVGRAMVHAGEDWLRQRDVVKVQLMVRETNTQVVGFYQELGFEVTPRVVMAKWLSAPE